MTAKRRMEMSEEIYANVNVTEDNRADSRDSKNSYEDVNSNQEDLEAQSPRNFKQSESSGGDKAWSRCYRLTAVCVVLLCVLLLTAVTVLWIKLNTLNTEYSQIQTSYNKLTVERDQLQTSYNNLTVEKDQLLTSNNRLTIEKDQLKTNNNRLAIERDKLQRERDGCQETLNDSDKAVYFKSSLYFMSNEKKNWAESRQDCKDKGAELVIINSKEKQDFIVNQLKATKTWIGLSDRDKEGEWKWVDGTLLTPSFSYWASNQPDNYQNDEDCAEIYKYAGQYWNDSPCSQEQAWICEKRI